MLLKYCVLSALLATLGLAPFPLLPQEATSRGAVAAFVPHGTGQKFSEKVEEVEVKLSSSQTDGRFSVQDELWHPGFDVKPHFHKEHAETFYVMSGQIEWTVNGETHVMSSGDIVFIPPKALHSVHVVGTADAHILFVSQPGGFEHLEEKRETYTDAQKTDPKIKSELREFGDAYFPSAK